MKEIFSVWTDKRALKRMLISGVVFMLVVSPFRALFNLIPGVTEIRPANMIPVVLGLLWGPAGAWGITLANAFSDILVSHSPMTVWIPGAFINFFYAYLPYKMWYSFSHGRDRILPPSLESVSQIIKYMFICLVDSVITTISLGLLFEALGFQAFKDSTILLFYNNFDFAIVLGVPAILVLTSFRKVGLHIPADMRTEEAGKTSGHNIFDLLLYAAGICGLIYFAAGKTAGTMLNPSADWVLLGIMAVILLIYVKKPMGVMSQKKEGEDVSGMSIRAKVIVGFLILSVTFTMIIGVVTYASMDPEQSNMQQTWQYLYTVVGIALNLLFLVSLIFLKYVETHITGPMEQLSEITKQFAVRDHRKTENNREFISNLEPIRTGDEVEVLSDSVLEMMTDITDYVENLEEVTRENERIGAELDVATQIQADMLPSIFPPFPERNEFDIYASMDPAREVGGDFYDFFLVDENHLAIVIADVSGKGVPAALFMVIAKTLIKNQTQMRPDPAEVFEVVNNQLCEGNEAGLFVTAWMGILDLTSGECVYANAGHNPPMVRHNNNDFEYLVSPAGFVLAGMEEMKYRQCNMKLEPGDKLFLYTDGVPEAENVEEELFGEDRLKTVMNQNKDCNAQGIIEGVQKALEEFVGTADQFDDITMVSLNYFGKENA